jgi:anti-sigma factor RsiW
MDDISEADLHAYVDGELDRHRRREVEAHLAHHPEAARRVAAWQAQKEGLHALFDGVLAEPLPPALEFACRRNREKRLWGAIAAGLWLALGVLVGWFARGESPTPSLASLPQEAAVAHVVYAPEVMHPVEVGAAEEAHLEKWLSRRLNTPLKVPDLTATGFKLLGGRLLPATEGPAAQFMYQDAQGRRLTLYVRVLAAAAKETAFRYDHRDGVGVFYWVDGGLGFALSGELERPQLLAVAEAVYKQLD